MKFNRDKYFDSVRHSLFSGSMTQKQVDGQNAILLAWEAYAPDDADLRWLAYCLATTYHETSKEMQPIEEYGAPTCGGAEYAKEDSETKQRYYGRGFVQLTWRENYERATRELNLADENDLEWHAHRALDLAIASRVMFAGMTEGWFRTHEDGGPENLERYFSEVDDDPFNAREIINGDKNKVPSWSNGVSIGNLIAGYHDDFLAALNAAVVEAPEPEPIEVLIEVYVDAPPGVHVTVRQM